MGKTVYGCKICNYLLQALPCSYKDLKCFKCHRIFYVPRRPDPKNSDDLRTPSIAPQIKNRKFLKTFNIYIYFFRKRWAICAIVLSHLNTSLKLAENDSIVQIGNHFLDNVENELFSI